MKNQYGGDSVLIVTRGTSINTFNFKPLARIKTDNTCAFRERERGKQGVAWA